MSTLIHIPEPCSENWNAMKNIDGCSRHCAVCKHPVHDFTNASFATIDQKAREAKDEKLCGNYHERHTTESKKVYAFVNAIERKLLKRNLKKTCVFLVFAILFLSGCVKRHVKGRRINTSWDSRPTTSKSK